MKNEIQKFEEKHMAAFQYLASLDKEAKSIESQLKEVKDFLASEMEKHGVESIDNDILKINFISPSESKQLDTKKWKAEKPVEFHETMEHYNKMVKRKGYVKFTIKAND